MGDAPKHDTFSDILIWNLLHQPFLLNPYLIPTRLPEKSDKHIRRNCRIGLDSSWIISIFGARQTQDQNN
jgi:hypothetical protein